MDQKDVIAFEDDTRALVPGFRVAWKSESCSERFLGLLLRPFNPDYMTKYISTFYPIVYFPSKDLYGSCPNCTFTVLAHERVHLLDTKEYPFRFRFSYLMPQIFALPFFLGACTMTFFSLGVAVTLFVMGLLFLGPWPSPWRVYWEKRGYAMNMAVSYWILGTIPAGLISSIKSQFLGWQYYRMSWSEKEIEHWISTTSESIRNGTITKDPVYGAVRWFMCSRGLVKL